MSKTVNIFNSSKHVIPKNMELISLKDYREIETEFNKALARIDFLDHTIDAMNNEIVELIADKEKQLAEARARIDHLERIIDEMTEEQVTLCAEGQSITELVTAKDKLIEQMREAIRLLADEYSLHVSRYENRNAHDDQCYIAAEQALAAERGE